jgi:hypothetical protein
MAIGGNKSGGNKSVGSSTAGFSSLQESLRKVDEAIEEVKAKKFAELTDEKKNEQRLYSEKKKTSEELSKFEKESDKKQQAQQKKNDADELKTKLAMSRAQHDLFLSVADKLPAGISSAVKTLGNAATSLKGLGSKALSPTGIIQSGIAVVDAFSALFQQGLQEKEKQRIQAMASEELRRSLSGSAYAAKDLIKQTVNLGHTLGDDFGPQLMQTSLDYAKAHFKTIEATKKWQTTVAQLALPENLGHDAQEVLSKLTAAGDKAYAGQGATDIGMIFKSMGGETIKKLGGTEGIKTIMMQYQKETGRRSIAGAEDAATLTQIINNMTSKTGVTPEMLENPLADLQQLMSQLLGQIADGLLGVLLPIAGPALRITAHGVSDIQKTLTEWYNSLTYDSSIATWGGEEDWLKQLDKAATGLDKFASQFEKTKKATEQTTQKSPAETTKSDILVGEKYSNGYQPISPTVNQPINITIQGDVSDPNAIKQSVSDGAKQGTEQALASVRRSQGGGR